MDISSLDERQAGDWGVRAVNVLGGALPWIAFGLALIAVCHGVHLQSLAEAAVGFDGAGAAARSAANWMWAVIPAACAVGLVSAFFSDLRWRALAAAAGIAVAGLLGLAGPGWLAPLVLVPVAVVVAHVYFSIQKRTAWRAGLFAGALLSLLLSVAAYKRQEMFFLVAKTKPDPDFFGYMQLAQSASGYETAYREPLFVWLLQVVMALGGEANEIMLRLFGVASGLAAAGAVFHLCRRHLNLGVAVIATYIYATQQFMVYTSTRGLREDTINCVSLLLISSCWSLLSQPATAGRLAGAGLLGAANSILRIASLSFAVVLLGATALWRMFRDIKPWRRRVLWLLPFLIVVGFTAPFLMNCKRLYGDAFFVVNRNAKFYSNQEFAGVRPEFPSRAEFQKDAYLGPRITPGEYVFKYHSLPEIVERTWQGFLRTFFGLTLQMGYTLKEGSGLLKLVLVLHVIGIGLLLFPRRVFLIFAVLLFHGPTFFLASYDFFDPRLLTFAMTFSYISVASAIGLGAVYGWRYLAGAGVGVAGDGQVEALTQRRRGAEERRGLQGGRKDKGRKAKKL